MEFIEKNKHLKLGHIHLDIPGVQKRWNVEKDQMSKSTVLSYIVFYLNARNTLYKRFKAAIVKYSVST